jgi:phosphoribosylformimino-5-aminoimidazole carboxamide ribotide isomerase
VRAVTRGTLLAAGGFAALEHIEAARDAGCDGAVVGRALYDGSLNLREALAAARA